MRIESAKQSATSISSDRAAAALLAALLVARHLVPRRGRFQRIDRGVRADGFDARRSWTRGYSIWAHLLLRGDYGRAIGTLRLSVSLRPTKAAFDNLGTAYFNSGRLAESIDAYNQSFQFGFASYESWLNLGDAYYWLRNRKDQASEAYAQAIRLGREATFTKAQPGHTFDPMIPANLATVFPKLGQPDSARAYLRLALEADSANSMVQCCDALTYWQLEERPQGLAWLERAVGGGYPTAWLRDSPVFHPWRSEPRFQALIADAGPRSTNAAR
jgi:tetratricopeptide (TPR) repeat protein